ncbi:MAG TPA: tRNA lysidine(34) synthetase TilS, partial [Bacteroidia bacterium]|nr:tRNA lysidine(34) synthetase TilS [Bacteroidia bacterium]
MLKKIEENISKNRLFDKKSKLLLGMSGGIDSVALASILAESYSVSLAHCNFNLRGKESKADEKFCESLAEKMGLPIYIQSFDTVKISKQRGISIQMAARELRYQWFEELLKKHKLDRIVTAHHADDRIETFFINLIRGSGVKGLKGMESRNGNVVRPMLEISKKEIQVYAEKKKIRFREDSSNKSDKYERNFLRHHIIPLFHKLNPSFDQTMIKNLNILKDESRIVQEYLSNISKK